MNDLESLGSLIAESIGEYVDDVKEGIDKETIRVAKDTKQEVEGRIPERTGAYKKSIRVKTERQLLGNVKATIHATKPHYRLTHLLEHGHALSNGGRSRAFPHWKQAEDKAVKEYMEGVSTIISKGGKK